MPLLGDGGAGPGHARAVPDGHLAPVVGHLAEAKWVPRLAAHGVEPTRPGRGRDGACRRRGLRGCVAAGPGARRPAAPGSYSRSAEARPARTLNPS